jgi:hypothetical protein
MPRRHYWVLLAMLLCLSVNHVSRASADEPCGGITHPITGGSYPLPFEGTALIAHYLKAFRPAIDSKQWTRSGKG